MAEHDTNYLVEDISKVIGIIESAKKAYDSKPTTETLPEAFAEVAKQLPLLNNSLEIISGAVQGAALDDESGEAMESAIGTCEQKATQLNKVFRKSLPANKIPALDRYKKAVDQYGNDHMVEVLMKGLLEDVKKLAGFDAIKSATKEQLEKLSEAIDVVSKLEPSIREESSGSGATYSHYGSGPQNIHAGKGHVNSVSGTGNQFVAETLQYHVGGH
jgi:hypothetical protein